MTAENTWAHSDIIHPDLLIAKDLVYNPCGLICTQPEAEAESSDYGAYTFKINNRFVKYRVAKITPTKTGQFVTLWKRKGKGPIEPFDISDDLDFFIASTRNNNHFGQFIFPKSVLVDKGIISGKGKEGKRAIRVYPPWDEATNAQARKTQQWQLNYFLKTPADQPVDLILVKKFFELTKIEI